MSRPTKSVKDLVATAPDRYLSSDLLCPKCNQRVTGVGCLCSLVLSKPEDKTKASK